jgi:hypothetical protein
MTYKDRVIKLCDHLRKGLPDGMNKALRLGYEVALDEIIGHVSKWDTFQAYQPTGGTDVAVFANKPTKENKGK